VALDMEIAVFRRLLESEEDRLGINIGGEWLEHLKRQLHEEAFQKIW
jgi:hypothetical protein